MRRAIGVGNSTLLAWFQSETVAPRCGDVAPAPYRIATVAPVAPRCGDVASSALILTQWPLPALRGCRRRAALVGRQGPGRPALRGCRPGRLGLHPGAGGRPALRGCRLAPEAGD